MNLQRLNKGKPTITMSIPVVCVDKEGKFLKEYNSESEAARCLGLNVGSVHGCASGSMNMAARKYFFIYKEYYDSEKDYSLKHRLFLRKIRKKDNNINMTKKYKK